MSRSTLNTTGESQPSVRKGHGTGALGPSDSTDSGSDIDGWPTGPPTTRSTTMRRFAAEDGSSSLPGECD